MCDSTASIADREAVLNPQDTRVSVTTTYALVLHRRRRAGICPNRDALRGFTGIQRRAVRVTRAAQLSRNPSVKPKYGDSAATTRLLRSDLGDPLGGGSLLFATGGSPPRTYRTLPCNFRSFRLS